MGETTTRIRIRGKGGVTIRTKIIRTIKDMGGGIIKTICHQTERMNHPLRKKLDLEQALAQMLTSHSAFMNETKANMQQQATQLNNQAAQLRSLEAQMGQMANFMTERQPGSLPSNSEVNPRRDENKHVKAVTLRSGKDLETKEKPSVTEEVEAEKVIQPSQNDDTNKEKFKEKQSEENTTEAKVISAQKVQF